MPSAFHQIREIKPAAPGDVVRGLLALPFARILSLEAGNLAGGFCRTGEYTLTAVVRGSLTISAHEQYALLEEGQAFVLYQGGSYTLQAVSDCRCMEVTLQGEAAHSLLRDKLSGSGALLPRGAAPVREAVMTLRVLEDEHPPVGGEAASACAYAMLMKLRPLQTGEQPALPPLVESAISIIQEEFPFLEGLEDLAQRLGVSKAHLSRTFLGKTGLTPGKYILRVKIEYAKLLLQDEDASISYVAEASGFANANYFAKVFRRETGMSPSEYLEGAAGRKKPSFRPNGGPLPW